MLQREATLGNHNFIFTVLQIYHYIFTTILFQQSEHHHCVAATITGPRDISDYKLFRFLYKTNEIRIIQHSFTQSACNNRYYLISDRALDKRGFQLSEQSTRKLKINPSNT